MEFPTDFGTAYANTEAIVKNCDTIQDLAIHLHLINGTGVPGDFDTWLKKSVRQIQALKILKINASRHYHLSLTKCLFYKYPNVETVIVEKLFAGYDWTTDLILDVLQDIKVKSRFNLECDGVGDEFDVIIEDLQSESYIALEDDPCSLKTAGVLLQVKLYSAMENMILSLIERPAPLHVRFPTQEEILTAPGSKDSSPEGYSEDLSETSDY